jgi:hypothetical protein
MKGPDRLKVLAVLAGTVFFSGLPQLWYNLTANARLVPSVFVELAQAGAVYGAICILVGLLLLALSLLLRTDHPYAMFLLGGLLAGGSLAWHLLWPGTVWLYFVLVGVLYFVLFGWRPEYE